MGYIILYLYGSEGMGSHHASQLAVISSEAQVRELIAEFREGLAGIDGSLLALETPEEFLKLSERQEVFLACIAQVFALPRFKSNKMFNLSQIIVEKQVPLKELPQFLDEKWAPFVFLAITQCVPCEIDAKKRALDVEIL